MMSNDLDPVNGKAAFDFSLRDVLAIGFRHKRFASVHPPQVTDPLGIRHEKERSLIEPTRLSA